MKTQQKIILSFVIFYLLAFAARRGSSEMPSFFGHGSRPAPEGNASGGPLRSEDRVP